MGVKSVKEEIAPPPSFGKVGWDYGWWWKRSCTAPRVRFYNTHAIMYPQRERPDVICLCVFGTTVKVCIKFGHLFQELMDRTAGPCLISSRFGVPDETDDLATRLVIINRQGEKERKKLSTFSSLRSISSKLRHATNSILLLLFNVILVCVTNYIWLYILDVYYR